MKYLLFFSLIFILGCASQQDVDTTDFSLIDFYLNDESFSYHLSESVKTVQYALNSFIVHEGETWRYRDCDVYWMYGSRNDILISIGDINGDSIQMMEGELRDTITKYYDTTTIIMKENYPDSINIHERSWGFYDREWFAVFPIPYDGISPELMNAIVMDDGSCWFRAKNDTARIYSSKYGLVADFTDRNSSVLFEHNREVLVLGYQMREFLAKEEALEK